MNYLKNLNWKIMFPILLVAVFQSVFNAFSSVLADIAVYFPDVSTSLIQSIITIPSLMSIPTSILAGILASYVTKKNLAIFALGSELVGGMIPVFLHNSIYALIASSVFIGIGQGFLISIASALVAEHFTGNERGAAMGIKQAASSVGIAALTVLTGYLALSGWYKAYYVYLFVIAIIILVILLLPKGNLDVKLVGSGVGSGGLKKVFTPGMIFYAILFFFVGAVNIAFYTNIAMSIMEKNLGDSSAIGVATAWNSLLTIVIGLIFGLILRMFKKYTFAIAMLIVGISYIVIILAPNLTMVAIGGVIYGIGSGIQMPSSVYYVAESVPAEASALAMAITMATLSLGITLSPAILNSIAGIFGKVSASSALTVAAVGYFILVIVEIIRELSFNRNSSIGKNPA